MMVESTNTSIAQVGDMISADQVLPTKVLRLINSAFFGFPGKSTPQPTHLFYSDLSQ